ncbi:putative hemin transport protein [Roseateles sp. YR242]|uniref:hemin-degrading factor n=1 Tax=Roseateles sp. YR242 TaxID=1855305 RepID=UPI0008B0EFBA|nr:ChuX/HutX family heme-like substrate-binding protein [Roseateles sp. YR242]SEK55545.1 putative hemin transport protein [Roseateles sp. YR242]
MQEARYTVLRQAFATARQERRARHRDIASALHISEGELLAAHLGAFSEAESPLKARRLRAQWQDLIAALEPLGTVMALTRNESCVHEKVGVYSQVSAMGPQRQMGLVLGGAIDLRVFYSHWQHGFAVTEHLADGALQHSLQFFDAAGGAIHKVFLKPESDLAAYEALVARFLAEDQHPGLSLGEAWQDPAEQPDHAINVEAFHAEWAGLRDTHDFFGLLKRHGLSRVQALRLAEARFVQPLPLSSVQALFSRAARQGVSIMVFVGNPGMIQIHSGPIHKVAMMGPWINVLDPGFNLHLREDHITSAWLVRKPTVDGLVCSMELFDAQGRTIAMMFGERKPGQAERADWRELLESMAEGQTETVPC